MHYPPFAMKVKLSRKQSGNSRVAETLAETGCVTEAGRSWLDKFMDLGKRDWSSKAAVATIYEVSTARA